MSNTNQKRVNIDDVLPSPSKVNVFINDATTAETTTETTTVETTTTDNNIETTTVETTTTETNENVKQNNSLDVKVNNNLHVADKVYHIVKDTMRGFDFNVNNVIVLVTKVVEVVDRVKQLPGEEKKNLTMEVSIKLLKEDLHLSETDQQFVEITLSNVINLVVQVSKGDLVLNSKKKNKRLPNIPPGQIVDSLVDKLVTVVKNRNYSANDIVANLSVITGMVMTIVEQYPNVSGIEKKNIAVQVLNRLVRTEIPKFVEIPEDVQQMLNVALDTVPDTIDILVAVSKGKFKINEKNAMHILGLLVKCFSPLCKKATDELNE